jgi:hypothetical protein
MVFDVGHLRVGEDCMNDVCVCDTLVASSEYTKFNDTPVRSCVP